MRFFLLMMIYGVLSIVLETTWLASFPADSLRIDLILPAVAMVAFHYEWKDALPVVIFWGVITDVVSGAPFGMSIFSFVIIYVFIRLILGKISFQVGLGLLFWMAIISLIDKGMSCIVLLVSDNTEVAKIFLECAPAQALLDSVVGLIIVPFVKWYSGMTWEKITRPKGLVMQ